MDTKLISDFMHTFIPDTGGWTWGDLVSMGALVVLGWTAELCKYLAERNGTYT